MKIGYILPEIFSDNSIREYLHQFLFKEIEYIKLPQAYLGLRSILIELKEYSPLPIFNLSEIYRYDYILFSITSYRDILWLISNFHRFDKGACKIIVGGAGCINIIPIIYYIDIAVFGRCDNQINDIINEIYENNVWVKKLDHNFEDTYVYGIARKKINILHGGKNTIFNENSYGCKYKCYFCHYSWANKYVQFENNDKYGSGYNENEDTLKTLTWSFGKRYLVSAIDGISEKSRMIVNKKITNNDIIKKFIERDKLENYEKSIQLKLYNIVGYPFESMENYYYEFDNLIKGIDKNIKGRITVLLNNTHFIPMPLTPMENLAINKNDYKSINYSFKGKRIKVIKSYMSNGFKSQALQLILLRLKKTDIDLFLKNYKNNKLIDIFNKYLVYNNNVAVNFQKSEMLKNAKNKLWKNYQK